MLSLLQQLSWREGPRSCLQNSESLSTSSMIGLLVASATTGSGARKAAGPLALGSASATD